MPISLTFSSIWLWILTLSNQTQICDRWNPVVCENHLIKPGDVIQGVLQGSPLSSSAFHTHNHIIQWENKRMRIATPITFLRLLARALWSWSLHVAQINSTRALETKPGSSRRYLHLKFHRACVCVLTEQNSVCGVICVRVLDHIHISSANL